MLRVTNRDRNHATVERLRQLGYDLKLSYAYGRPRVVTQDERRDISPRLIEAEMRIWLDAFVAATEEKRPYSMPKEIRNVYRSFFDLLIQRLETIREHINDGKPTEARALIGDTVRTLREQQRSYDDTDSEVATNEP